MKDYAACVGIDWSNAKHDISVDIAGQEERELYTTFTIIRDNVIPLIAVGNFSQAQKMIFRIRSSINTFFDKVMVMTENKRAKRNRLALLQEISKLLSLIAD